MSDWQQELVDFINEKSKEHEAIPENKLGYFNLMAQLARHQVRHAEWQVWNDFDKRRSDYPINPTLSEEDD